MTDIGRVAATCSDLSARARFRIGLPGGGLLDLGERTRILGVINVTPDSFSDGGRFATPEAAVRHGLELVAAGADMLDVGGESTRPGAAPVTANEERARILGVIETLARQAGVPVSVDTTKPEVARDAVAAGAVILNDVSMLRAGNAMAQVAATTGAALILMHSRGTPATMATLTDYPDGVVAGVIGELQRAVAAAREAGIGADRLLVDPGIGFAKTAAQSLELLAGLPRLGALDLPLVVGVSRKSFIGTVLDLPVEQRQEGTLAAEAAAVLGGAHVLRTHDAGACRRLLGLLDALPRAGSAATLEAAS